MDSFLSPSRRRGVALVTVALLTTFVGITAAVLLRYAIVEFRLNQRTTLRFASKNAAEAMMEYGAAELMARLQRNVNFSTNELISSPLTTATTRKAVLFASDSSNLVSSSSLRLYASAYSEPGRKYVDPGDPGNDFDPLRGQNIRSQTIRLLSRATATSVTGITAPAFAVSTIEIRDVFLFNYAIFYNLTMEFHPGADMTISGPVHSNVDSRYSASSVLRFQSPVTAAGRIIAAPLSNAGSGRPTGQNVQFATGLDQNADGVPDTVALNSNTITGSNGSSLGTYVDSDLVSRSSSNSFAQIASQVWRGNAQDSSMGVIQQNLPAISAANPSQAHDLIEPKDTTVTSSSDAGVQAREAQKFSNKAGLYIVQGAPGTDTAAADSAAPVPFGFKNATDAAAYKAATNRTAWRASNPDKVITLPTGMVKNTRRMKDWREAKVVNAVDVDMAVMRTAVNPPGSATATQKFQINGSDWNLDSASDGWNGQVYVEVESPLAGYTATSDVNGSGTGTATSVRLLNGARLPNRREYNTSNAMLPEGVTVATNAPVYVVGNYNSPGLNAGTRGGTAVGTETTATIGLPKDNEVPAAIIADAVNILSNAWVNGSGVPTGDTNSFNSINTGSSPPVRVAANTEICAAFLTGNVATSGTGNLDANYSGGVENFPRLHESWSASGNRTLRYRGSMVALFNSEVATGRWTNASYGAPTREWGFNRMFADGRQPPGTPMLRSFRRLDYRDISESDFNTFLASTTYDFTEM